MIIKNPPRITNKATVLKYLEVDLWTWLKSITTAFTKLNFEENFQSFLAENIEIPAGREVAIPNGFKNRYPGLVPSGRIISRQKGDANIIDGDSAWNENLVFLKNPSANNATVSVIFFK